MKRATHHILVVDDESAIRMVIGAFLEQQGHTAELAEDGYQALQRFAKQRFDLLVSDVIMPGMSGPELVKLARERQPDLKVLLISGYAGDTLDEMGDIVDYEFLSKPFTMTELAAAIDKILNA